jgi:hypothetical protein
MPKNDAAEKLKLSGMDIESYKRWYDCSKARDLMVELTDSELAPWRIVHSDDKKRARPNVIAHILSSIPYKKIDRAEVEPPNRSNKNKYDDRATIAGRRFAAERY